MNDIDENIIIENIINDGKPLIFGLVFRNVDNNEIYLGEFKDETIKDFKKITDEGDNYKDLPYDKFYFSDIKYFPEGFLIRDHGEFAVLEKNVPISVTQMLENTNFPNKPNNMFKEILKVGIEKYSNVNHKVKNIAKIIRKENNFESSN